MRELTEAELDLISGGWDDDDEDIVVTGSPYPPPWQPPYYGPPGGPFGPPSSPSSPPYGGGLQPPPGYNSQGTSIAANIYASAHVKNQGTTAEDQRIYQQAHDDWAKFYDYAQNHLTDTLDIGNGKSITYMQALNDLGKTDFVITDTGGGANGAWTVPTGSTVTIEYNPQNANMQNYVPQPGTTGEDYVIFHEMGHALNFYENSAAFSDQAAANTAGRSMESALGITQIPTGAPGGYD